MAESKDDQNYPLNVVYCGGVLAVCRILVVYKKWYICACLSLLVSVTKYMTSFACQRVKQKVSGAISSRENWPVRVIAMLWILVSQHVDRGGARGGLGGYSPLSEVEKRFFRRFLAFIVP